MRTNLVFCRAVHVIGTGPDRKAPGAEFELPRAEAEELEGLEALEILGDVDRPTTLVNGIGQKTSAKLEAQGVETLLDLADLPAAELEGLAARIDVSPAALESWVLEAQGLVAAERSDG